MGDSRVGFSGSYPFGSVAYDGAIEESTRGGDDAQPARRNKNRIPRRTTKILYPMRPASPPESGEQEYRSANKALCETMRSLLPFAQMDGLQRTIESWG